MFLIDVFALPSFFLRESSLLPPEQHLFRPIEAHTEVNTNLEQFSSAFHIFTGGLLRSINWKGLVAAGGSVLAAMSAPPCGDVDSLIQHFDPSLLPGESKRIYGGVHAACCVTPSEKSAAGPVSPHANSSDVDLFLVGLDKDEAVRKVEEVYAAVKREAAAKTLCITTQSVRIWSDRIPSTSTFFRCLFVCAGHNVFGRFPEAQCADCPTSLLHRS